MAGLVSCISDNLGKVNLFTYDKSGKPISQVEKK